MINIFYKKWIPKATKFTFITSKGFMNIVGMNSKIYWIFLLVSVFFIKNASSQSIVINEVSNGTGISEYVEFIVTGDIHCDSPPDSLDLRHWIFDDNNGYFASGGGTGIAQGACRFSNDDFWKAIPTGTLIVIYRDDSKNSDIPADDLSMDDGNCTLVIPINSTLIDRHEDLPSSSDDTYATSGWKNQGDWETVSMSNSNDSYQIRDINNMGTPVHSVSYGNNTNNTMIYFSGSGKEIVYYFDNTVDDDPFNQNSWIAGSTTSDNNNNGTYENGNNDQTPGYPNSINNENWVITLNHNCTLPPTVTASDDDTICNGETVTISASGGGAGAVYTWDNGLGTGTSKNVNPSTTTQYIVTMTENGWCVNDTVIIVVNDAPSFTLSSTDPTTCGGTDGSITLSGLDANTTYKITYDDDGTTVGPNDLTSDASGDIVLSSLNAGDYTNFKVELSGCEGTDNSVITLIENGAPTVDAGDNQEVCEGDSITLTATNPDGATISWDNGITDGKAFVPALGTTTYTVSATLGACTSTDTVNIIVNPRPLAEAGDDQDICKGDTTSLIATGGDATATYLWSNGAPLDSIAVWPTTTTLYYVTVTQNTCSSTDSVTVSIHELEGINLDDDMIICSGEDTTITVHSSSSTLTYLWDDGSTDSTRIISPTETTYYFVTAYEGSCSASDTIQVKVNALPRPQISGKLKFCKGKSTILGLTSSYTSYLWNTGDTISKILVDTASTISVTVTDNNTCKNTVSVTVSLYDVPTLSVQTDVQEGCEPLTVSFNTTSSCSDCYYIWNFERLSLGYEKSPQYTYENSGTYHPTVSITTADGCSVSSEMEIQVYPMPEARIDALPPSTNILDAEIKFENYSEIEGTEKLKYLWYFGDGYISGEEEPYHTYDTVGIYMVDFFVTSEHACKDSISIPVRIDDFFQIYFPNIFTPGSSSGINNYFYPRGVGAREDNYLMIIYDRWGEPIFETTEFPKGFSQHSEVECGWNGRYNNTGEYVQNGMYVWVVRVMDGVKIMHDFKGVINVVR